jgi:predicted nucleic acid-binding Zn ribbon protein
VSTDDHREPEGEGAAAADPATSPDGEGGPEVDLARSLLAAVRRVTDAPTGPTVTRRDGARPGATPTSRPAAAPGTAGSPTTDPAFGPGIARDGMSGPRADDRDPQPLGRAVDRMVGERGWEVPVAVGGIAGRWPELVGEQVAEHCVPEGFVDGILTVRADSTAWATQVRLLAGTLVQRLNVELGPRTVTAVSVLGPTSPSWRRGRLRVPGRGPRDTYG